MTQEKNIIKFYASLFVCYLAYPLNLVTSNKLKGEKPEHYSASVSITEPSLNCCLPTSSCLLHRKALTVSLISPFSMLQKAESAV